MIKRFLHICSLFLLSMGISGCSTNPATGENQFTALMSPQQEVQVGAQEHAKIMKQYGVYDDEKVQAYIDRVGEKVVQYTERPEVDYKFFLLDSPIVNAFALPGGYVYLTRGLLSLSNSEAEMAAVLAHETGHITARHSAERYSRGVATSVGATLLSAALGSSGASEALGMGANLYLKSYSRGQEHQADSLGIRYLSRTGYAPSAMTSFLSNLQAETNLQAKQAGRSASASANYFSTHPATAERVSKTISEANLYAQQGIINRDVYLRTIDGMTYGDSAAQGFVRENTFYHPPLGFKFSVPDNFKIVNQPTQVLATSKDGSGIIFDFAPNKDRYSAQKFLSDVWLQGKQAPNKIEGMSVNGMRAATTLVRGQVNGRDTNIRLVAIEWEQDKVVRFQIGMPLNLSTSKEKVLKSSIYSFKRMTRSEQKSIKPYRLKVITSRASDTVASLSKRMPYDDLQEDRFRVLNGLAPNDKLVANRLYKMVVK